MPSPLWPLDHLRVEVKINPLLVTEVLLLWDIKSLERQMVFCKEQKEEIIHLKGTSKNNVSLYFFRRGKVSATHIGVWRLFLFTSVPHSYSSIRTQRKLSAAHTHTPPYAKHKFSRILYSIKDFLWHPKIPTILASQPLLQLHCWPRPCPVKNVRLALAQGFVHQAHCLGRKYSYSGYPLCLAEPMPLCRGTQHFHST